jgi:flagellar basal body L-ring protein FlgH
MAAKKNNKNTNNNQTKEEALKEAALTSNGDDIIVPSPLTKIADLRPGWIGDCCFRVIEESKEEEEEEDEDEKRRKQTQQHPNASSSSKQHQNSRRFREFLVGDVSGKIKFRCSEKREGESSSRLYSVISSSSLVVVVVLSFWILRRADGQTDTNRKRELIRDFESSERYFSSQLTPVLSLSLSLSIPHHITNHPQPKL